VYTGAPHHPGGKFAMSLPHAHSGDVISVRPFGNRIKQAISSALVSNDRVEVMRLVMEAGKIIPPHELPGEVTIQCLEGVVELDTSDKTQTLEEGDMVYLEGGEARSLRALMDSSVLMTLLRRHS
jgi:quercetin dioxygenase-like cupin family protein